jgi:hypothetical protein
MLDRLSALKHRLCVQAERADYLGDVGEGDFAEPSLDTAVVAAIQAGLECHGFL